MKSFPPRPPTGSFVARNDNKRKGKCKQLFLPSSGENGVFVPALGTMVTPSAETFRDHIQRHSLRANTLSPVSLPLTLNQANHTRPQKPRLPFQPPSIPPFPPWRMPPDPRPSHSCDGAASDRFSSAPLKSWEGEAPAEPTVPRPPFFWLAGRLALPFGPANDGLSTEQFSSSGAQSLSGGLTARKLASLR